MQSCADRSRAPIPRAHAGRPISRSTVGWLTRAALSVVMLTAISCNDLPPAPDADIRPLASMAPAEFALDPDGDGWNRFEADVAVRTEGSTSPLMPQDAARVISYRVTKHRAANGIWLTDIEMNKYLSRFESSGSATAPPSVGRIEGVSRTTKPTFYDISGRRMILQSPEVIRPSIPEGAAVAPAKDHADLKQLSSRETNTVLIPGDTSRSWIAQYIVTPTIGATLRGSLEQSASKVERGQGRTRFIQSHNDRSVEISIDDATGAIMEVRALEGGNTRAVVTRDWAQTKNGTMVIRSERAAQYPAKAGAPSSVVTTFFRNIRLVEGS